MIQSECLLTLYSGLPAQIMQTIQKILFTALEKKDDGYCGHRDMLVLEHWARVHNDPTNNPQEAFVKISK